MESIVVIPADFHKCKNAFKLLFNREPIIETGNRFEDISGCPVFGSCPVLKVGKTTVTVGADGETFKAYINKVNYFTFR